MVKVKVAVRTVVGLLVVGAALTSVSSEAVAVISTNALAACTKATPTGTLSLAWNGIYNLHPTETMYIDCSIPSYGEGVSLSPQAWVDDRSGAAVSCYYAVAHANSSILFDGGSRASTGSNGVQRMDWPASAFATTGIPYMACSIPPKSGALPSGVNGFIF